LETDPPLPRKELFGERSGIFGAAAPDLLFNRLNLHIGDRLKLGSATFELRARLVNEPDAISDGFGFAPRLMISSEGLAASGLVQPGSLVENAYKVRLPDGASEARIKEIQAEAAKEFPQAGWSIRTRSNAAP
ncbi:MAG: ABC transporter permease, partial [Mesorhizobium sp.]